MSILSRVLVLCAGASAMVAAQAPPKWEVISVKACDPSKAGTSGVSGSPGRLSTGCTNVHQLIGLAYAGMVSGRFQPHPGLQIVGAPAWITSDFRSMSDRYVIDAKAQGTPSITAMLTGPMMQALLAERFKLKAHFSTREVPVYALAMAKGPLRLGRFEEGSCQEWEEPGGPSPTPPSPATASPTVPRKPRCAQFTRAKNGFDVTGASMKELGPLFGPALDRPVIDETGIAGRYNLHLDLTYADLGIPGDAAPGLPQGRQALTEPADRFDSILTALRKIGLDLQAKKGPEEILVVDNVERPSQN